MRDERNVSLFVTLTTMLFFVSKEDGRGVQGEECLSCCLSHSFFVS